MSGIEIAGLVLGGFPLIISALEHSSRPRKIFRTFWKVKRAYDAFILDVEACRLQFWYNLVRFLSPLVGEEVLEGLRYADLLEHPDKPVWENKGLLLALSQRLMGEDKVYMRMLEDMGTLMVELCEASRVNDAQFKAHIESDTTTAKQPLMKTAYFTFQRKRMNYSFTGDRREALLARFENANLKLKQLLDSKDQLVVPGQSRRRRSPSSLTSKRALQYWRHADKVFDLLKNSWQCTCSSLHCAHVWLQLPSSGPMSMKMLLKHTRSSGVPIAPWKDQFVSIELAPDQGNAWTPKPASLQVGVPVIQIKTTGHVSSGQSSKLPSQQSSPHSLASVQDLRKVGLCKIMPTASQCSCLGALLDDTADREYLVNPAAQTSNVIRQVTLEDVVRKSLTRNATRVQRCALALALVSAQLQLQRTPWVKKTWSAAEISVPLYMGSNGAEVLDDKPQPFIMAGFEALKATSVAPGQKDNSFSTLAILLLELCFGDCLDNHKFWTDPNFAAGINKADPFFRQAVALKWLDDVPGEAGIDYASAVEWVLRQAPFNTDDDAWRADFAALVVEPLERCYSSMIAP